MYDRLKARGIELARKLGPASVHADTAFEPPCQCQAQFQAGLPFRLGAFSGVVGGAVNAAIGRYCSIAPGSTIAPGDHPLDRLTTSWVGYVPDYRDWRRKIHGDSVKPVTPPRHVGYRPARIGHDVWIGAHVFVRGGIEIGDGAVVAAGSVVVKDVPPYAIVGGNPARILRMRFDDRTVERLLALRWWRFSFFELAHLLHGDLLGSLDAIAEAEARGELTPYDPGWISLAEAARG